MAFTKAVELFFAGGIIAVVLMTFLAGILPIAQETIDNANVAHPGTFAMGEAAKLMLGLIGFVFVAGLLYAGVMELIKGDNGGQGDGRTQVTYGYGG
jgi:hypothetical protein